MFEYDLDVFAWATEDPFSILEDTSSDEYLKVLPITPAYEEEEKPSKR